MTTFAVTNQDDILPALNYVLSNLDLGSGGGGNGNANIPGNVIVANTQSGIINNYGNTSNAAPYWFLYQYINLRYANSATGTGFNTVSSNANYFGTFNSTSTTPSSNPTDYTWTQVAGGFGTANTIYYSAIGGRQVVWVSANAAPSALFVQSTPNVAIDLDVVTTANGTPGLRGPISMAYIVTTGSPVPPVPGGSSTLTGWFSASPGGNVAPIGVGLTPVVGDIATFTYAAGVGKPNYTYSFNGSDWVPAYAQRIDGNVIIQNTLAANAIIANSITATQIQTGSLTTDLFTANTISGNIIQANTLSGDTVIANTLSGNTIIADSFTANTINGNSLVIGSVTNTQIANGTITTDQIQANTITATNIAVGANITGAQIAAGTITANNLAANTLTANTVVSTGATLGSFSSQGFWLDGPSGNARFGNTISIGNSAIIGSNTQIGVNLNIGGNATIGANLRVGNNAVIGNLLTIGTNASVGNNITILNNANIGANLIVGANANIGANLLVGANANIGSNLIIGGNANIGQNLRVGNNAVIGSNVFIGNLLSIGVSAFIGNNLTVNSNAFIGNNLTIGRSANIGNNLTIGSNVIIGNNANIGGNATIGGVINNGALGNSIVGTVNLAFQAVSIGNGYINQYPNETNVQIFSNTTFNQNQPIGNAQGNLTLANNQNVYDVYLWGSATLSRASFTAGTSGNINFTASLIKDTPSTSPEVLASFVFPVPYTPGTNNYRPPGVLVNGHWQSTPQFTWNGIYDTTSNLNFQTSYYLALSWAPDPSNGNVTFMNAWSEQSSLMVQMLKR